VSRLHTIDRWLRDRAALTPARVAIEHEGGELTYAQLDERSERLAETLLARGLERGDRVATLTANSPAHVEVFFACAKAGLMLMPLNWRLSPVELAYQIDDAEPVLLLVEEEHDELASALLAEAGHAPQRGRLGEVGEGGAPVPRDVADDDGLLLVYTSGTTGKPKGAVLTHANCYWTNLGFDLSTGVSGDDVVLQVLPQFHCGGWNVHPLLAWWKGARVLLERSFDPDRCLGLIESRRVTTMMGVPAIYLFLSQAAGFASADLTSLRRAVVGGAPMPETLLETWQRRGIDIVQGYGLTEAAPNVLCLPPEDARRKMGYAGKPYPYVETALHDPESGVFVQGPGQGELVVRGPNVFPGYWRNPAATAEILAGGWLHTGDVAERDAEGYYRIRGRLKDMFVSGGENVYPAEVENVLLEHPAVADAAVVGVGDDRWGEVGVGFVVLALGATASEDELREFCAARIARYKVPKAFQFAKELPRSAMNKVLKDELRALYEGQAVA
jgi:fatty-acyl-CoA synthase